MLLLIVIALIVIGLVVLAIKLRSARLLWAIVAICSLGILLVLMNLVAVLSSDLPAEEVEMLGQYSLITVLASVAVAWFCFRKAKQIRKEEQEALTP